MIDILIIGSGGAGLTTALKSKEIGLDVLIATKSNPTTASTSMAQGGINSYLRNPKDSIDIHIKDTIKSAHNLCDNSMVEKMCKKAPLSIKWLESIGVPFSRQGNFIAQRKMGGATEGRTCYAQDYTGLKILHTLYDNILKEDIPILEDYFLLSLINENNIIKGATFLDISTGEIKKIEAKTVVIATGGYGGVYYGYSNNAFGVVGDGIATVLKAGGVVSDMEFIQFHPTALKNSNILISESARGEGGYLINSDGNRFIDELKPRDEVARAIIKEIEEGKEVFLDIRHLGEEKLMHLLPQEVSLCRLHEGIDPLTELIPIKPIAHYTMGGIDVDKSHKISNLKGAYAIGECANAKVHGANRLGGNSLLEIIAFGIDVVENIKNYIENNLFTKSTDKELTKDKENIENILNQNGESFYLSRIELGRSLYKGVGILRDKEGIEKSIKEIEKIEKLTFKVEDKAKKFNTNLIDYLEFSNSLYLSKFILKSSLKREESRGAHFRLDYPNKKEQTKHLFLTKENI